MTTRKVTSRAKSRQSGYRPARGVYKGRKFASKAAYRRALERRNATPIRSRFHYQLLSDGERGQYETALRVLSRMRNEGGSLTRLAQEEGIRRETVRRFIGDVLERGRGGRYLARPRDGFLRVLEILTPRGRKAVEVTDSRTASKLGAYWNAVDTYLRTGDWSDLRPFRGRSFRAGKVTYPFLTDPRTLKRLAETDEVRFESIYAHVA